MNARKHLGINRKKRWRGALVLLGLAATIGIFPRVAGANSPPEVSAVRAIPTGPLADQDVMVRFDLADADGDELHVTLQLFDNNGSTFLFQCEDTDPVPGTAFAVGADKSIIWNAQAEFPGQIGSEYVLRVIADDGFVPPGFVQIPPQEVAMPVTFTMGSTVYSNETPHQVTLTGRFNMASTEVTNAQYVSALQWAYDQGYVTATTSSVSDNLDGSTLELLDLDSSACQISFSGGVFSTSSPDRPVVVVSWYGAVAYCDWLSLQEVLPRAYDHSNWSCNNSNPYTATGYRLPTEAEREIACRAGTTTHFNTGGCLDAGTEANYKGIYPYTGCLSGPHLGHTADVGSYPANQWGLFDMHGNVWEWCNDWYGGYAGDATDPEGAGSGDFRVLRGGEWGGTAYVCRSAFRNYRSPYFTLGGSIGFRPVRSTQ